MGSGHLDCCWLEKGSVPHPQMCTILNYPLKTSIICNLLCILIVSRTLAVISVPDLYQRSVLKTHFFHAMVNTPSSPIIHHMIYTSVHNHLSYIMTYSDADSVTVGVVMTALLLHKLHSDTLWCRQCDQSWLHCYYTNFTVTHSDADSVISHGCTVTTQTSQWHTLMQTVWSVMTALLLHKPHNDTLSCRQCDRSWLHCYCTNLTMTHSHADSVIGHNCTVTTPTSQRQKRAER